MSTINLNGVSFLELTDNFNDCFIIYSSVDTIMRCGGSGSYITEIVRNGVWNFIGNPSDAIAYVNIVVGKNIIRGSFSEITFDNTSGSYTIFTKDNEQVDVNTPLNDTNSNIQLVLRKSSGLYWLNTANITVIDTYNKTYQGMFRTGNGTKIVFTNRPMLSDSELQNEWNGTDALADVTIYVPKCRYEEFSNNTQTAWPSAYQTFLAKVVQYNYLMFDNGKYTIVL